MWSAGCTSQSAQDSGFSPQPTMGKRYYTESSIRMVISSGLATTYPDALVMT